jgi:hypothetical protein
VSGNQKKYTTYRATYTNINSFSVGLCPTCFKKPVARKKWAFRILIIPSILIVVFPLFMKLLWPSMDWNLGGAIVMSIFLLFGVSYLMMKPFGSLLSINRKELETEITKPYAKSIMKDAGCDTLWTQEGFEKNQKASAAYEKRNDPQAIIHNIIMGGSMSGECQICGASISGRSYDTSPTIRDLKYLQLRAYLCKKCGSLYCYVCREKIGFSFLSGFKSPCPKCGAVLNDNLGYIYDQK